MMSSSGPANNRTAAMLQSTKNNVKVNFPIRCAIWLASFRRSGLGFSLCSLDFVRISIAARHFLLGSNMGIDVRDRSRDASPDGNPERKCPGGSALREARPEPRALLRLRARVSHPG